MVRWLGRQAWLAWLGCLPLAGGWGCDRGNVSTRVPDPDDVYPSPPMAFSGALVYVNAAQPGCEQGDGTAARPFCGVGQALASPPGPLAVLVAPADYPEAVQVTRSDVWIMGRRGDARARLTASTEGTALTVTQAQRVVVDGLQVGPRPGLGVLAYGGELTLQDVQVREIGAGTALPGDGIVAVAGARLTARDVAIDGVARVGLLVADTEGPDGRLDAEALGVRGFGAGGISAQGQVVAALRGITVEDGGVYGVGAFGATLSVDGGTVARIARVDGQGGDAVVGALGGGAPAALALDDLTVEDSARVGILADGAGGRVAGVTVRGSAGGGLWAIGPHTLEVADSRFERSAIVGLAALDGAQLTAREVVVDEVVAGVALRGGRLEDVGDGVMVLGARLEAEALTVAASHRAGLLLDSGTVDWQRGEVSDVRFGVVVQNGGQLTDAGLSFAQVREVDRLEPAEPLPVVRALGELDAP
ncbi:MAG: hypothetical protein KC613_05045 [Myxococcales bacterium]|nr:hypothetical protein [Myxococcales bacterium]MCB9526250.1 hypothetical protein [Myxococcales bacterium]